MLKRCCLAILSMLLCACVAGVEQRGMQGDAYVSTARPNISLQAKDMPLITAGEGTAMPSASGALGGLPTRVWIAVYGKPEPTAPLAIVAHAELPEGWYWDGSLRRPFSVDESVEVLGGIEFQACTFLVDTPKDLLGDIVARRGGGGETPTRWLVRAFAARQNFTLAKLILEYREPAPAEFADLPYLPMGQGDTLTAFERRARDSFAVGPASTGAPIVRHGLPDGLRWRYMDEKFLGTASRFDPLGR
ncbi:MAG: DUF4851 domain-containing protein [Desulfovibrio sp.]|jgi:hypothetical protein|nr:DUF4851 domain-containing protein [Desulfovibrio sp.]